jgi:hypothetical protein
MIDRAAREAAGLLALLAALAAGCGFVPVVVPEGPSGTPSQGSGRGSGRFPVWR